VGWDNILEKVLDLLTGLYPTAGLASSAATRAGLPSGFIDFNGPPIVFWMNILQQAKIRDKLQALVDVAHKDYPNIDFPVLLRQKDIKTPSGPKMEDKNWKGPDQVDPEFEKVMGTRPTFLPISFLETGLERAKSVVRVVCPGGFGSGFLIRDNLLITNHHVISNEDQARKTKVECNYQLTAGGLSAPVETYKLSPDEVFATSPMDEGDDWTVVRVEGDPNSKWGSLALAPAEVKAEDYVQIVQHPSGEPKQVALYHNVVAFANDDRVQYLTDTLPGSSGSPVFDKGWRLVALHHSGGWITEPGSKSVYFRNEGIHVNALLRGLQTRKLV